METVAIFISPLPTPPCVYVCACVCVSGLEAEQERHRETSKGVGAAPADSRAEEAKLPLMDEDFNREKSPPSSERPQHWGDGRKRIIKAAKKLAGENACQLTRISPNLRSQNKEVPSGRNEIEIGLRSIKRRTLKQSKLS